MSARPVPPKAHRREVAEQHQWELERERRAMQEREPDDPIEDVVVAEVCSSHTPPLARPEVNYVGDFDLDAMLAAFIFRRVHRDVDSYHDLELFLKRHRDVAESLGFDEKVPDHTTFSRSWRDQFSGTVQNHIPECAESAVKEMRPLSPDVEFLLPPKPVDDSAPDPDEITAAQKDRAYNRLKPIVRNIVDYGRAQNSKFSASMLTDYAGYISRRNTFAEQGTDRFCAEENVDDGEMFDPETFRRAIRKKGREWAMRNAAKNGHIDPKNDAADERDWTLDPYDTDFEGDENWHRTQELGIGRVVRELQSDGMLDRPVDICIDGTVHDYHKRDAEEPDGVHYRADFDTHYGWEDLTVSAIYKGRAIVLGSFNYVPENEFFASVKYLLDRATDLLSVDTLYADAEFATMDIMAYCGQLGIDYIIRKGDTEKVQRITEGFSGRAGYKRGYEMIREGGGQTHRTNLVSVEKRTHIGDDGEDDDSDGEQQTLTAFSEAESEELGESRQVTFDDLAPDDVEYVSFVTNKEVTETGFDPARTDRTARPKTVWRHAESYRQRWSIETAFRQIKEQFMARSRSRDLGVRRFFWMMAVLLYNVWACLNLLLQYHIEFISDDEPPVRANVFLEEFANWEFG